jgi:subtilisin family serine protease
MKFFLGVTTLVLGLSAQSAMAQSVVVSSEEVPGEIIVKYKEGSSDSHTAKRSSRVLRSLGLRARFVKELADSSMHHLQATEGVDAHDLIKELNRHPDVAYAEPNYFIHLAQEQVLSAEQVQTMSSVSSQSAVAYTQSAANVKVAQAWQSITGSGSAIVVAVVDTGVDYNHYVLTQSSSIWTNAGEIPNNGIDDDGNGFVDDVKGWNFNANSNNPMDDNGHGTHVAGIIVGVGQNIFASQLSKSNIKVMALKFMDSSGNGTTADAVSAINYAVKNGARVINNSWGGTSYSQSLHDSLANAYANGVFIASAAGNYGTNDDTAPLYPANLSVPSQVSTAASDNFDSLASFSSFGPTSVHVSAPGVSILSTYMNNTFAYLSGTSMASPFVAGLAALAMYQAPQLTGYQVKSVILGSADPVSNLKGYVSTGSRVDAYNTIQTALTNVRTPASQPSYSATPPAGAASSGGGSSSSSGCGLVSAAARGAMGGGDGSSGLTSMALLLLPLAVWLFVRASAGQTKPYRRRHQRFAVDSVLQLNWNGQLISGRVSTLGMGGLAFKPDQALASLTPGGQVFMSLQSPQGDEQVDVQGKVVWSENGYAFGVQFNGVEESSLKQLGHWLSKLK